LISLGNDEEAIKKADKLYEELAEAGSRFFMMTEVTVQE